MMLTERNKHKLRDYILSNMLPVAQSVGVPEEVKKEYAHMLNNKEVTFIHWSPYKGSLGVGQGFVFLKFNKQIIKDYFNFYRRSVVRQSFLEFNVAQDLLQVLSQSMLPYGFSLFEIGEKTLYSYLLYGVNGVKRGQFFNKALAKRLIPYDRLLIDDILGEEVMDSLLHSIQGMGLVNEHTLNFRRKLKSYLIAHKNEEGCLNLEEVREKNLSHLDEMINHEFISNSL